MNSTIPVHQGHSGGPRFPLRYFAAAFAIGIFAAVFNGWQLWYRHNLTDEISRKHLAIKEGAGRIMLLDEALTMSARMAAATGDFSYEKRYDRLDPQLTAEIKAVRAALPDAELEKFVGETDEANLALVKMERQAFALAHQGRLREATALLAGDDYMRLKKVYSGGMEKTDHLINDLIERNDRDHHLVLFELAAVSAVSVLAMLVAWFLAVRATRSWIAERSEAKDALRKANAELEARVEQRTADLLSVNESLNKANFELNRNQALLKEVQRLGHLGSWELDVPSGEAKWSDETYRVFEQEPARFSPSYENFLNVIHPDDRDMVNQAYMQSLENRQPYDVVHRLLLPDGRIKWVHEHCTSDFDESGRPLRSVGAVHDITAQKLAEEKISNLAFYDPLTQLPNRRLLNDRLGRMMAASRRSGHYSALMFLDLDNFKPLNDTYGHGVGDLLLIEVARRIAGCVREADTVARFGGDEFVALLVELVADRAESAAQAGIVAERIRAAIAEPYLLTLQQDDKTETTVEHHCTSSIGIVLFISHEGSPEDILKWADIAMYQAKEGGRNLIRFYDAKN
ncbi:MAG TPA: diguanylate cyclase [Gallionella sp.]|nr:diguanylate cyclase [Gallionella sp.]